LPKANGGDAPKAHHFPAVQRGPTLGSLVPFLHESKNAPCMRLAAQANKDTKKKLQTLIRNCAEELGW
jgi:hypothetical protein